MMLCHMYWCCHFASCKRVRSFFFLFETNKRSAQTSTHPRTCTVDAPFNLLMIFSWPKASLLPGVQQYQTVGDFGNFSHAGWSFWTLPSSSQKMKGAMTRIPFFLLLFFLKQMAHFILNLRITPSHLNLRSHTRGGGWDGSGEGERKNTVLWGWKSGSISHRWDGEG